MFNLFRPLIGIGIKIALVVGAVIAVFWALGVLAKVAFVYGGGLVFGYGLLMNRRRLLAGVAVGYGIILSAMLFARLLRFGFARDSVFAWHSHDAADVARYAAWMSQHHLVATAATTIVLVGFAVGIALAPGAAGWRLAVKDSNGHAFVDDGTVVNRLVAGIWSLFPWASRIDSWRDGNGSSPPRTRFSLSPRR